MVYLLLAVTVIFEVIGTMLIKATDGFTKPVPSLGVIVSYGIAFYVLSHVMKTMPVGIAYAMWGGFGIILVSLMSYVVHKQELDLPAILGIALIVAGVVVINLFSKSIAH